MAFRRGYRAELELVELLKRQGYHVVRFPVSGGRTISCDIIAAKGEDRRAYQVKETKLKSARISGEEIRRFLEFSQQFGFRPYIAIRWKYGKKRRWDFAEVNKPEELKIKRS